MLDVRVCPVGSSCAIVMSRTSANIDSSLRRKGRLELLGDFASRVVECSDHFYHREFQYALGGIPDVFAVVVVVKRQSLGVNDVVELVVANQFRSVVEFLGGHRLV